MNAPVASRRGACQSWNLMRASYPPPPAHTHAFQAGPLTLDRPVLPHEAGVWPVARGGKHSGVGEPWFPAHVLREYALIADGERGAIMGPKGDIGWLCVPRWDSDSVFSSMMGGPGYYSL